MYNWRFTAYPSSDGNVRKYVFRADNAVAETVLYKYPTYNQRTVICCSTMSGCPMGCRFCGAGDSFVRSLKAEEILLQVLMVLGDQEIDPKAVNKLQIMFMSMGEPMLNMKELTKAIRVLHTLIPDASLLVSTSAPKTPDAYEQFIQVSREVHKTGLQFSVHETTDAKRNDLIPFKAKLSLKELALEGELWYKTVGRKPFFNYCAHEGNVTEDDADRLRELFDPDIWEATISVVCEREENVAAANERQRELAAGFRKLLGDRGFNTRIFDPAGQDDIGGGCGQLWYVQDWMRKNPHLARPSAGRGLNVLHAPLKLKQDI